MTTKSFQKIVPYFQYIFDKEQKPVSAEILMRQKNINTETLIANKEKNNTIFDLDLAAFKAAQEWNLKYNLPCASNFSGITLADKKFIDYVILEDITCKNKLELTEQSELTIQAVEHLEILAYMGFAIALDDYGSDRNGANRIVELTGITEVKLDKFLIDRLADPKTRVVVAYSIGMFHAIDYTVVAEGVEEEWQFDTLVDLGCDRFQGYLLHKPEKFEMN